MTAPTLRSMTATLAEFDRGPLYPVTPGFPRCASCFQRTPDLALTADPRDHLVRLLCRGCSRALNAGQAVQLPTGKALADTWEWLARSHINHKFEDGDEETGVTEQVIDTALATLAPHLDLTQGWAAFEQYYEALLDLQEIRDPNADPRGWDCGIETAEELAIDDHEDALRKLTGSRS